MGKIVGKIAENITQEIASMALVPSQEFNNEDELGFIPGSREPELRAFNRGLGIYTAPIQADATAFSDMERVHSEIKEKQGKLFVVLTNNEMREIRPHDLVTADEGCICFCRLRGQMMRSIGKPIIDCG